jgi:lipid II:glycine glycyltransferase (peptidoglycan interpeptide bridge formation enzyme)
MQSPSAAQAIEDAREQGHREHDVSGVQGS